MPLAPRLFEQLSLRDARSADEAAKEARVHKVLAAVTARLRPDAVSRMSRLCLLPSTATSPDFLAKIEFAAMPRHVKLIWYDARPLCDTFL